MNREVRIGQLIAPFGPGAIYTDRQGTPLVVCGLDHWFKVLDHVNGLVQCQKPDEFQKFEPRLAALLRVDRFCRPPDFRSARQGQQVPPNAWLYTPAQRFPRWYRHSRTGEMKKFNLSTEILERSQGADGFRSGLLQFVQVAICANSPGNSGLGANAPAMAIFT